MKAFSILLALAFLALFGTIPAAGQNRFSVAVSAAPLYGHSDYKIITPYVVNASGQLTTSELSTRSHSVGYSFGLLVRYTFSPKWSVTSGIWATQFVTTKGIFSIDGLETDLSTTNKHPFVYAYKVPLLINYKMSTRRLSPYFSAGATLDFRARSYIDLNGQEVAVKFGKAVTINPILSLGAIYQVNNRLSVAAQPTVQYNIQDHSGYTTYHNYLLSLQLQLLFAL